MKKSFLPVIVTMLFQFAVCQTSIAAELISMSSQKSTYLYPGKAALQHGGGELSKGRYLPWHGDVRLVWNVEVPQDDVYELYLIANVRSAAVDNDILLKTSGKVHSFLLSPTKGPYGKGGPNFQKVLLSRSVTLKKGTQELSLATEDISGNEELMQFRAIEWVPMSARQAINREHERAVKARASTDWLVESGYGLMFHWTSQSVQRDGSIKKYEEAVNDFNVERFSDMVEQTGAGYVFLTIGHAESYCPAPLKSWEKCHPGMTTERDLIMEIANSLAMKNIRFLCYINGPSGFNLNVRGSSCPSEKEKQEFVENFNTILAEMGARYKDKVSGYWFDSWYQIFEEFPEVPFEEFHAATKIGNEDRVICLNSWIYPPVTPWQEYWAGEVGKQTIAIPQNGYMVDGPVPDLRYHALMILEKGGWVQKTTEEIDPHFHAEPLSRYILDCQKNGGAVTINLSIFQDGTIGRKSLEVMKEVKSRVRPSLPR